MKRLYNLDYLRGLAAFGIMIFHYLSWTFGDFSADSFIGRLGIYGVSVFYVLSGLTLFYVYFNRIEFNKKELLFFFKKRVFRIFPLLWLVTLLSILLSREVPDFLDLFLNLTGLFGFVQWDKYFSAGVWSIGNELVFYVFFPFFLIFMKKSKLLMILTSVILLGLYIYFAFVKLTPDLTLGEQWKNYINPLNQVFLFLGGFLIAFFGENIKLKNSIIFLILISSISLFIFYPVSGDSINLVTETNRLVFTFICFLVCLCFYKLNIKLPNFMHKPLIFLGEASYSIYLVHPIVWTIAIVVSKIFSKYLFPIPTSVMLFMSVILTLITSYYVYQYFEKYFIKLGKKNKISLPKNLIE